MTTFQVKKPTYPLLFLFNCDKKYKNIERVGEKKWVSGHSLQKRSISYKTEGGLNMSKLKTLMNKIKQYRTNGWVDKCYADKEYHNMAAMGSCCGLYDGDENSGGLHYECLGCKYLVMLD